MGTPRTIAMTFERNTEFGGYTSTRYDGFDCPPWIIADTVLKRVVAPEKIRFPRGYGDENLKMVRHMTQWYYQEIHLPLEHAARLAAVGEELLRLDTIGLVQHPLNHDRYGEKESVEYFLGMVAEDVARQQAAAEPSFQ